MILVFSLCNYIGRRRPISTSAASTSAIFTCTKVYPVKVLNRTLDKTEREYLMMIFLISHRRDGSDEGSQHMFYAELTKNFPNYQQIFPLI